MESRRLINTTLPRMLVLAQIGLWCWAVYAVLRGILQGEFLGWEVLFAFARILGAYGIANESRFGWVIAVGTCIVTVVPALAQIVTDPWLLVQPDQLVLLAFPVAILFFLYEPSGRDYQRAWFR